MLWKFGLKKKVFTFAPAFEGSRNASRDSKVLTIMRIFLKRILMETLKKILVFFGREIKVVNFAAPSLKDSVRRSKARSSL